MPGVHPRFIEETASDTVFGASGFPFRTAFVAWVRLGGWNAPVSGSAKIYYLTTPAICGGRGNCSARCPEDWRLSGEPEVPVLVIVSRV
ncbi:hypothetical protein BWQ96_06475 [Gracilariopsis chorda]|uniref:Uncharacterized protein n=1 Tax=Gracilariopsis chorda TaxID=448386 RepID=A0A2V3INY3_9FLOR|nr:hypothetical protein BWQ96_06475 [Gracilariopsis chorda]|eukprot:PXF43782.1 hypothetical protein BWQ96_06475 [Gracilariopsis chorda]